MEITPLKRYDEPDFPTRVILDAHPELLRRLPNRWQRNTAIGVVLAAACSLTMLAAGQAQAAPADRVAPVFPHGAGDFRGMFATMPTTSPVFLPEDEARLIIVEELKKAGLKITPDRPKLTGLTVEVRDQKTGEVRRERRDLVLDGEDPKRHVAYEFLSQEDWTAARPWEFAASDTQQPSYGMPAYAEATRAAIAATRPKDRIGIFYDPAPVIDNFRIRPGIEKSANGNFPGAYAPGRNDLPGLRPSHDFPDATLAPLNMLTGMLLLGLQSGDGESKVDIEKETIAIRYGGHTLVLTVGSDRAVIDGEKVTLAAPVSEHFDSVYFPLRPVLAVLGFTVTWNEKQATVTLAHQELQQNLASQVMETIEEDPQRRLTFAFLPGDNDSYLAIVKEYGREDLRRQVRDFVAWLKAEGVI